MQYREHCATNLIAGTLLMAALGSYDISTSTRFIFAGSFIVATFLLSPDLDIFHSSPNKNWGKMRLVWWPYTKIFSHRGMSHTPILGTWTRILYVFFLILIGFLIYDMTQHGSYEKIPSMTQQRLEETRAFAEKHQTVFLSGLAGITASDLIHLLIDKISSFVKKI